MKEVLIRNQIDNLTDIILEELENLTSMSGMEDVFSEREIDKKKIGRSQLNSLLQNSRNASSVEELKLFIAYKEAKEEKNQGWARKINDETVAQRFISSINEVEKLADNVVETVERDLSNNEKITEDDIRIIKLSLVEKFLGYMYWKGTIMGK